MFPITPNALGPGIIIGAERTITKHAGSFCWSCNATERLDAAVYDSEGMLVRRQTASGRITIQLEEEDGQIAVITHSQQQRPARLN